MPSPLDDGMKGMKDYVVYVETPRKQQNVEDMNSKPKMSHARRRKNSRSSSKKNNKDTTTTTTTTTTDLTRPTTFRRVGASIGHKSPTLHSLLNDHVPGVLVDEEDGILAMFRELHQPVGEGAAAVQVALRQALQACWRAWQRLQTSASSSSSRIASSFRDTPPDTTRDRAPEDDRVHHDEAAAAADLSVTAAWRELVAEPAGPALRSATAAWDSVLARLLHALYTVNRRQGAAVAPTPPQQPSPDDEDLSLHAMVREMSQQLPGLRGDDGTHAAPPHEVDEVERHLLGRLQQISEESNLLRPPPSDGGGGGTSIYDTDW